MKPFTYIMEGDEETLRLDRKTDPAVVEAHARWAGLEPGMRVADLGFGSGKTTACLHRLAHPGGGTVGVDIAADRIRFAQAHYDRPGIRYVQRDVREPLADLEPFDFAWVRFVLEYHRSTSVEIVRNIRSALKPGGILCLIDLDYNCLTHYGFPQRLESTFAGILGVLEARADFDPYAGRKLYAYLYDAGFEDLQIRLDAHHLIYGELNEIDAFNWRKKVEVAAKRSGYSFDGYAGGYEEFREEFLRAFADPRRFTYTPVICCRGRKPA